MYVKVEHHDPKLRDLTPQNALLAIGDTGEYYLVVIPSHGSRVYAILKTEYAPVEDHDGHDLL